SPWPARSAPSCWATARSPTATTRSRCSPRSRRWEPRSTARRSATPSTTRPPTGSPSRSRSSRPRPTRPEPQPARTARDDGPPRPAAAGAGVRRVVRSWCGSDLVLASGVVPARSVVRARGDVRARADVRIGTVRARGGVRARGVRARGGVPARGALRAGCTFLTRCVARRGRLGRGCRCARRGARGCALAILTGGGWALRHVTGGERGTGRSRLPRGRAGGGGRTRGGQDGLRRPLPLPGGVRRRGAAAGERGEVLGPGLVLPELRARVTTHHVQQRRVDEGDQRDGEQ